MLLLQYLILLHDHLSVGFRNEVSIILRNLKKQNGNATTARTNPHQS